MIVTEINNVALQCKN